MTACDIFCIPSFILLYAISESFFQQLDDHVGALTVGHIDTLGIEISELTGETVNSN